jgi:hypothetical protein
VSNRRGERAHIGYMQGCMLSLGYVIRDTSTLHQLLEDFRALERYPIEIDLCPRLNRYFNNSIQQISVELGHPILLAPQLQGSQNEVPVPGMLEGQRRIASERRRSGNGSFQE